MINKAMQIMELQYPLISILKSSRSQKEVNAYMLDFKDRIKKQRRLLVKKYHPDINGNGEETMKIINAAYDFLNKINIKFMPPQRPQFSFYYSTMQTSTQSYTSTAGSY